MAETRSGFAVVGDGAAMPPTDRDFMASLVSLARIKWRELIPEPSSAFYLSIAPPALAYFVGDRRFTFVIDGLIKDGGQPILGPDGAPSMKFSEHHPEAAATKRGGLVVGRNQRGTIEIRMSDGIRLLAAPLSIEEAGNLVDALRGLIADVEGA